MFVLLLSTSLSIETIVMTVPHPSFSAYNDLHNLYSDVLKCPCSNVSIPYQALISWAPTFHQVCSSDFIDKSWISSLYYLDKISLNFLIFEWNSFGMPHFLLLSTMCQLSNETVSDAIQRFGVQSFVTLNVIKQADFISQVNSTLNQVKETLITNFALLIDAMQLFTQTDQPYTMLNNAKLIASTTRNETTNQPSLQVGCSIGYQIVRVIHALLTKDEIPKNKQSFSNLSCL